jgi:acyl-coenzyme A synthetase/AMP-(fatty) acid ligase
MTHLSYNLLTVVSVACRSSLRVLGSVGEPINPEAWRWYVTAPFYAQLATRSYYEPTN